MGRFFLGLDLGGTTVKAGIVDPHGKLLSKVTESTGPEKASAVVAAMVRAGQRAASEAGVPIKQVAAVGVLSPGQVVIEKGIVIRAANFPAWRNVKLRALVTKALGVPGVMENDAKAAAYGEYWAGVGRNRKIQNLAIITLGTGIGGGVIHRGTIYHGSHGFATELGHMIVVPGGEKCGCGQRGCFEMYASARNVGVRATKALNAGRKSSLARETGVLTSINIEQHAKAGDPLAKEIWDQTCHTIALAAINAIHFFDPDTLVLGGGMSKSGSFLITPVMKHFHKLWWKMTPPTCKIEIAKLGSDAGMIGAAGVAKLAFDARVISRIGT